MSSRKDDSYFSGQKNVSFLKLIFHFLKFALLTNFSKFITSITVSFLKWITIHFLCIKNPHFWLTNIFQKHNAKSFFQCLSKNYHFPTRHQQHPQRRQFFLMIAVFHSYNLILMRIILCTLLLVVNEPVLLPLPSSSVMHIGHPIIRKCGKSGLYLIKENCFRLL